MYTNLYILILCISQGITGGFELSYCGLLQPQTTVASVEKWTTQKASNTCGLDQDGNAKKRLGSGSVLLVTHWVHSWRNSELKGKRTNKDGDRSLAKTIGGKWWCAETGMVSCEREQKWVLSYCFSWNVVNKGRYVCRSRAQEKVWAGVSSRGWVSLWLHGVRGQNGRGIWCYGRAVWGSSGCFGT